MKSNKLSMTGGPGGKEFNDYVVPRGAKLREIRLLAGSYVNAIQFIYTTSKGNIGHLDPIGGMKGDLHIVTLPKNEHLTGISGHCGWYIDSLRFHTNKRTSDTFGGPGGEEAFNHNAPKGSEIVGFFGRADWHIDAIGIITRKLARTAKPKKQISKPKKPAATSKAQPKELQKVEGVGPKIAASLIKNGIRDLKDLSKTKVSKLKTILQDAGSRYRLANPTTLPEQAALGAKGDWKGMEKLKAKLTGGRTKLN